MSEQVSTHTVINGQLAKELNVPTHKIEAAVGLLDEGASVPFIARYRKEVTGGLDDTQLRLLAERLDYLRELHARRAAILESIETQGKLTPELRAQLEAADNKQRLEDLYAPYKPKRRTRAQAAIEAGLEPLADALLADPSLDALAHATGFLNPELGIATEKAALDGARDILAERFAHDADVVAKLRGFLSAQADIVSTVAPEKAAEGEKFRDYFAHREAIRTTPSHRALALLRGRAAGILSLKLALAEDQEALKPHPCETLIAQVLQLPASAWLADVCRWAWRVKLHPALELEFFSNLRASAETEAIGVFGRNLKDLLLAPPAGAQAVIGLDPGLRTGVKVAVVDPTGKVLATATIFPHAPRNDWHGAIATLAKLARAHGVTLLAIGNGTASRETDRLAAELIKAHPELGLAKAVVSEAGASVYSASALAAEEFPDLDVSLRGAVSIARRLQDPLAELVKIEPKAIGVGQYQHDVNQSQLARTLDAVVEDCVNAVGVDVNTASAPLLARVSGLNASLAKALVAWREAHGAFGCRQDLRQVPRLGERAFEQAAGFLRITGGSNPLDASGVHPEAYPVVERILAAAGKPLPALMGQRDVLKRLAPKDFTDERFGLPTVVDILAELEKPGRDPRPEFKALAFREGVENLEDLKVGMILDGVVTNVANFGAFVDVGVHQDGLVHISALAERFVKDPHEVVKAGDHVKVKVLEVDIKRRRIALSMRLSDGTPLRAPGARPRADSQAKAQASAATGSAMAQAFANLRR